MNEGKYVFSQVTDLLPRRVFDRIVAKFDGNKYIKHFTCWNQMLCMMFGQLCGCESLNDLLTIACAHRRKFYHLGFGKNISLNNLSNANIKRDYRIYESLAYHLVKVLQQNSFPQEDIIENIDGPVYAIDSTVIDLCLSVFCWAKFRKEKAGIKAHIIFDVKNNIPSFIFISEALLHDVHFLDMIDFEMGAYYIFDKAYIDFERLFRMNMAGSYFVTRLKKNATFIIIDRAKIRKKKGIRSDHTIEMVNYYSSKQYPGRLRKVRFYDEEKKRIFTFITNNFDLKAEDIALLYKYRWRVELFFKWIKQHLKVKSFWGTSANAVKTQIYIAIITYVLVVLIKAKLKLQQSAYEVLQIMSVSLLDKTPLRMLFENPNYQDVKELNHMQLKINLI